MSIHRGIARLKTKKYYTLITLLLLFAVAGSILLLQARAATSSITKEAESGTVSGGATVVNDSTASGQQSIHFNVPQSKFNSALNDSAVTTSASKDSYGSTSSISTKSYTKMTIGQVADAATTSTTSCSPGSADSRLKFLSTTCETFDSTNWRQQGITGVGGSGWSSRNDIILVSWHNGDGSRGRLTVMNRTTKKQTFVELVRPCGDPSGYCSLGGPSGDCGTTHAGGIAWYKNSLFVADSGCIIVFDLNNLYKASSGTIVLPTTQFWKRNTNNMVFSSMGVDLSNATPRLLVSEYISGCTTSHFGYWNLDPATANLQLDSGSTTLASIDKLMETSTCNLQGIAYHDGMYFLSTSGASTDYLYRIRSLASAPPDSKYLLPYNTPQGIYFDPTNNTTWGLTESPGTNDTSCKVFSYTSTSITE